MGLVEDVVNWFSLRSLSSIMLPLLLAILRIPTLILRLSPRLPVTLRQRISSSLVAASVPPGTSTVQRSAISAFVHMRVLPISGIATSAVDASFGKALAEAGHEAYVLPAIDTCLSCSMPLTVRPATNTGGDAMFYSVYQAGIPGTEYVCECQQCGLIYDCEGYYHASAAMSRLKLPLPPEHRHPDWIRVSSRTFLSRRFTLLYEKQVHASHCSFEGLARVHNSFVLGDMPLSASGTTRMAPQSRHPVSIACMHAWLRAWLHACVCHACAMRVPCMRVCMHGIAAMHRLLHAMSIAIVCCCSPSPNRHACQSPASRSPSS